MNSSLIEVDFSGVAQSFKWKKNNWLVGNLDKSNFLMRLDPAWSLSEDFDTYRMQYTLKDQNPTMSLYFGRPKILELLSQAQSCEPTKCSNQTLELRAFDLESSTQVIGEALSLETRLGKKIKVKLFAHPNEHLSFRSNENLEVRIKSSRSISACQHKT